jgi:mRNA interferase RelE/StbE
MAEYNIFLKRSAVKELETLPQNDVQRILKRTEALKKNPRLPGSEKLSARERYRFRQGYYRIAYAVQDTECCVHIFLIGHRRDVYR